MTTLTLKTSGSIFYTNFSFSGLDTVVYPTLGSEGAIFSADQFDGVQIRDDVTFVGANSNDYLFIHLDADITVLDARGWQFASWNDYYDRVISIVGLNGDNLIYGPNQASFIASFWGTNQMFGGSGDDRIMSSENTLADQLDGGGGSDFAIVYRSLSSVSFYVDFRLGGGGRDIGDGTRLRNFEGLLFDGGSGDDRVLGSSQLDNLTGGAGNDYMRGLGGDDQLTGGMGNDILTGNTGADELIGGSGRDVLKGGAGADLYTFRELTDSVAGKQRDIVLDFKPGTDRIDLSAIDAIDVIDGETDDPFTFIGAERFTKTSGELRYRFTATETLVIGDINGDGLADFRITLIGEHVLSSADFVL